MNRQFIRDHFHFFVYPQICKFEGIEVMDKESEKICKMIVEESITRDETYEMFPAKYGKNKWGLTSYFEPVYGKRKIKGFPDRESYRLVYDAMNRLETLAEKKDRRIVFPGRDCWPFYVVAQKRGLKSVYIPWLSRKVLKDKETLRKALANFHLNRNDICFDTGFQGSIPRGIEETLGFQFEEIRLLSSDQWSGSGIKYLLNKNDYRTAVLNIEECPKYYHSGYFLNQIVSDCNCDYCVQMWGKGNSPKIDQILKGKEEFIKCAQFTLAIWNGSI